GDRQRLTDPVVALDPPGDVHRRDGDVGPQRLDDRVAAGDDLAAAAAAATLGRAAPAPLVPGLVRLVRLVVRPLGRLWGRPLALEAAAALAAGADLGTLLRP